MAVVLVVDDEKEIAQLLDVCLKSEGFETIVCYTAQQAEQAIEQEKIDLAILDVMLPDGDGFSLCREIRKRYYYPIVMLTARDSDTDKIGGLGLGADDYVTKPFQPEELMARVHAQLRRYIRYNQPQEISSCRDGYRRTVFQWPEPEPAVPHLYPKWTQADVDADGVYHFADA